MRALIVTASLAAVNLFWLTGEPWFMVFMVGWGAPLAGHCAFGPGLVSGPVAARDPGAGRIPGVHLANTGYERSLI